MYLYQSLSVINGHPLLTNDLAKHNSLSKPLSLKKENYRYSEIKELCALCLGHALSGSCYEDLLLNTDNKNLGPESNNEVQVHHTTGIRDGMPIKHLVNRGVDNYFTFGLDYNPVN